MNYTPAKTGFHIKTKFVQLLDSLIHAPASCEEAYKQIIFDSVKKNVYASVLEDQNERIQTIFDTKFEGLVF